MRISPINSQAFKGLLIIPSSTNRSNENIKSPRLELETDNIIQIDNSPSYTTDIKYLDEAGNECDYKFYKQPGVDNGRILLAYAAASADRNVVIIA